MNFDWLNTDDLDYSQAENMLWLLMTKRFVLVD